MPGQNQIGGLPNVHAIIHTLWLVTITVSACAHGQIGRSILGEVMLRGSRTLRNLQRAAGEYSEHCAIAMITGSC